MQRPIDLIVVHCSDTPAHMDTSAADIDRWHKERGWKGIGYHYVVRRNGVVERGRPLELAGAHVAGHNANSIGICVVGGGGGAFNFTTPQMDTLADMLIVLTGLYPQARVCGHRDLDPGKACPTIDVTAFWEPLCDASKGPWKE
jgi:N-acetyl-anhydromuramyl-L-alanine amidase AmpD